MKSCVRSRSSDAECREIRAPVRGRLSSSVLRDPVSHQRCYELGYRTSPPLHRPDTRFPSDRPHRPRGPTLRPELRPVVMFTVAPPATFRPPWQPDPADQQVRAVRSGPEHPPRGSHRHHVTAQMPGAYKRRVTAEARRRLLFNRLAERFKRDRPWGPRRHQIRHPRVSPMLPHSEIKISTWGPMFRRSRPRAPTIRRRRLASRPKSS